MMKLEVFVFEVPAWAMSYYIVIHCQFVHLKSENTMAVCR